MYYVTVTTQKHTSATAARIDRAVKRIHPDLAWVGPLSIPGSQTRGWLERPNDGMNDSPDRRSQNQQAKEKAIALLEGRR
jgi:hypothetical protein